MFQTAIRLLLALMWLALGVALLGRSVLLPDHWLAGRDPLLLTVVGVIALLACGYNLLRVVRRRRPALPLPNPLRTPPEATRREYIPELDFNRKEPPPGGEVARGGGK